MALLYQVKVGSVSNLTDARYFNAIGADWIGFNLDAIDDQSLTLKDAKTIKNWLFEPKIVIECAHHQDSVELVYLANELEAEAIEIDIEHPLLNADHFIYPVILKVDLEDIQHVKLKRALASNLNIEVIVLKDDRPDFDWNSFKSVYKGKQEAIARLKENYTILIDLPFEKEWFLEALELLAPNGIHIGAEKEEKPGLSKVDEYDDLMSLLETET